MKNPLKISQFTPLERKFAVLYIFSESWIFASFWVIFLTSRDFTLVDVALVDMVFYISVFLFEVPTGTIADKFGRKFSIIMSNCLWTFGLCLFILINSIYATLFSFFIMGIAMTLTSGAREAWIYDEISHAQSQKGEELGERYQFVFGVLSSIGLLSKAVGGVIGGLVGEIELELTFYLAAMFFLFSGIWAFFIPELGYSQKEAVTSTSTRTVTAFRQIFSGYTLYITLFSILTTGLISVLIFWFQPYLDAQSVSYTNIGIYLSIAIILASFGSSQSSTVAKLFRNYTYFLIVVAYAAGFILMSFIGLSGSIILFLIIRGFRGVSNPFVSDQLNKTLTKDNRATSLSILGMISTIGIITFELSSAFYIENSSYASYFLISGIVLLICVIPISLKLSRITT